MTADTIIPVTISGTVYQARAADCWGELVNWGYRWLDITPAVAMRYGIPEEYAHGFCEYVRDSVFSAQVSR